jgi:hypothetical protein
MYLYVLSRYATGNPNVLTSYLSSGFIEGKRIIPSLFYAYFCVFISIRRIIMSLISSVNIVTSLGAGRPENGVWIPDKGEIFFNAAAFGHTETNA